MSSRFPAEPVRPAASLSPLVGEIEREVRAFGPRAATPGTPTPAPPHKGEGLFRSGLGFIMLLALAACGRETRDYRSAAMQAPSRAAAFENNAWHIAQGQRLFGWMNCSGCHGNGGGDKGPALMDEHWIYGSAPEQIFDTIVQGRPNGMPAYRGRIPDAQVWELVAYVRSISGLASHSAAPGRNEHMQSNPAENSNYPTKHKQPSTPPATSEFSR